MKPNDIDAIINSKLQENHELYDHEMNEAKPFIWGEIRNKINQPRSITWYHLAAAMILLLMVFSFVYYSLNQRHQLEINTLSEQLNQLQKANNSQFTNLKTKDSKITALGNELGLISAELRDSSYKSENSSTPVSYRVDTIYISEPAPQIVESKFIDTINDQARQASYKPVLVEQLSTPEIDEVIFPDFSVERNKQPTETIIKVKFGTFTARKD